MPPLDKGHQRFVTLVLIGLLILSTMYIGSSVDGWFAVENDLELNPSMRHTVHLIARALSVTDLKSSVDSFRVHRFHVVVWAKGPDSMLRRKFEALAEDVELRSLDAYVAETPKNLEEVIPFKILADHGGWFYSPMYLCQQDVEAFVRLTNNAPFVMAYDPELKRPSTMAMYFCNRTFVRHLVDRVMSEPKNVPAKVIRNIIFWGGLRHHLFPMHVLLGGTRGVLHQDTEAQRAYTYAVFSGAGHPRPGVSELIASPTAKPLDPSASSVPVCATPEKLAAAPLPQRDNNETHAHFLWLGGQLKPMAWCAIHTFVTNKFKVSVWTYAKALNVPGGAKVRDIREFFPPEFRFTIIQNGVAGSPSGFSNLVRYQIIKKYGGWWFDTDVLCLRPVKEFVKIARLRPVTVAFEDPTLIDGAVMHLANRSIATVLAARADAVLEANNRSVKWGMLGPRLITNVLSELGLSQLGHPAFVFYPVHWTEWHLLLQKAHLMKGSDMCQHSLTVHLWNEVSKTKRVEPGSLVAKIIRFCPLRKWALRAREVPNSEQQGGLATAAEPRYSRSKPLMRVKENSTTSGLDALPEVPPLGGSGSGDGELAVGETSSS